MPEFDTFTVTVEAAAAAGAVTVIDDDERLVTVPRFAPKATVAPVRKPDPEIVTFVPPATGPAVGFIDQAVGASVTTWVTASDTEPA